MEPSLSLHSVTDDLGDGNVDKHNTLDPLGPPLGRRASHLALQRRLGVLPERRAGSRADHPLGAGGDGTTLNETGTAPADQGALK